MKEAYLYKKLEGNKVQCENCAHYCTVLPGKRGICGIRKNIDGTLYALNYGKVIACNIDPVEKKPLFHFLPGTKTLSLATVGCNMKCKNCQNYDISQGYKEVKEIPGKEISPEEAVQMALQNNLPSISYTYVEPVIFSEYALDIMKIAKEKGLKNIWVCNGYLSKESRELIAPYLDAINIDVKSFSNDFYKENCGATLEPVLETAKEMKEKGVWTEITTLVIPGLSDSEKTLEDIAKFIKEDLGEETPWHVSRFSGAISWKLQHLPDTPLETLQTAYNTGKKVGLKYVYTGNVLGLSLEDTFCPECNALLIDRTGYTVTRHDKQGKCFKCNENLNIILE